jgi:hypothetical protein
MKGGGTVVSLTKQRREALINTVQPRWIKEADTGCGPELAGKFRALIAKHAQ